MVQPYKFPADAHITLKMDPPVTLEDLPLEDLKIIQSGDIDNNLEKLSLPSLKYLKQESEPPETPLPKKVLDYSLDTLGRGWEAMRERSVSSGKMAEEGLKEFFGGSPIDAEGNIDILPQLMGAGKTLLGPLGIATAPGAGLAEMVVPPEMPQDENELAPKLFGKSPNEIRDISKLISELLLPLPRTSGKKPKFEPDNDLVNKLGGTINAEEKRFIDVYIRAMARQNKKPTNDEIMEVVNVRFPNRTQDVLKLDKEGELMEFGMKESHIPEFSNIELEKLRKAGIKFGDEDLADMMNMAQQLRDAGFGKDTFFSSTLGLSKIPKGVRPKKSTKMEALASFRATMMTSGVMTSIRNAEVTAQYFIIDGIDRALRATLRKGLGDKALTMDELGASYVYLGDVLKTLNPANKLKGSGDQILKILRANRQQVEKAMALLRKSHEVSVPNRVMAIASVLNNMQEYFFRRMAIEASLRSSLRARGKNFDTIHPRDITKKELQDAFENGFTMTMAKSGMKELDDVSGRVTKGTLDHLQESPVFKLFVMPFPRFVFRNMLPFIRDFSPLGYFRAINPKVLNKLAHGKPEEMAGIMSKAMIGSTLLGFGMAMRGSEELSTYTTPSGERVRAKYYQWVRKDAQGRDYTVDLRVISPTVGPYLYMAEQFLYPKNVTPQDLGELTLGLRRWGALAMSAPYEFFTKGDDPTTTKHFATNMGKAIGEFAGSFMPQMVNSLVDLSAGRGVIPPEMASYRSDAAPLGEDSAEDFGNQMWATFVKNMPIYKQILPERFDPLDPKKGRLVDEILADRGPLSKINNAVIKQLSGLRVEYVSPLRAEFESLKLAPTYGGSRTGVKLFDNMANELIARSLTSKDGLLDQIKEPKYRALTIEGRRDFISKHIYGDRGKRGGVAAEAYNEILIKIAGKAFPREGVGDPRAEKLFFQAASAIVTGFAKKGRRMTILDQLGMPTDTSKQNVLGELLGQQ